MPETLTQPHESEEMAQNQERFTGTPTEVPFQGVTVGIEKEYWRPGILDSNGGLIGAHDPERPEVHLFEQGDIDLIKGNYKPGSATVPLTGGDRRGWRDGPLGRDMIRMQINHEARAGGVMGRTLPTPDGKYEMFDPNPFDKGDFIDMTGRAEVTPAGQEIVTRDLASELVDGQGKADMVGKFNESNGMLAWVTPEGHTQIAPATDERVARLQALGYRTSDINVPHSNGEAFKEGQWGNPEQELGEVELNDMERAGQTMTMDERHTGRFKKVIIPVHHLNRIKN